MEFKNLSFTQNEKVLILTISRPGFLNALNAELLLELDAALDELEKVD